MPAAETLLVRIALSLDADSADVVQTDVLASLDARPNGEKSTEMRAAAAAASYAASCLAQGVSAPTGEPLGLSGGRPPLGAMGPLLGEPAVQVATKSSSFSEPLCAKELPVSPSAIVLSDRLEGGGVASLLF